MSKIKWYKRDPKAALTGMMPLNLEQRGAYNTVLDLIYSDGGEIDDDDFVLAGWMRCDVRKWRRLKAELLQRRKIYIENGKIRNERADKEAGDALGRIENASKAGKESAKKRKERATSGQDAPQHRGGSMPGSAEIQSKSEGDISSPSPCHINDLPSTAVERPFQTTTTTTTSTTRIEESPSGDSLEDRALAIWNEMAKRIGLPVALKMTDDRRRQLRRRLKEHGGIEGWRFACEKVRDSPYLRGENDKGWRADIDFLVSPRKFLRVIEGFYDDKKRRTDTTAERRSAIGRAVAQVLEVSGGSSGGDSASEAHSGGGGGLPDPDGAEGSSGAPGPSLFRLAAAF